MTSERWMADARQATPENQAATEAVMEYAHAWDAGALPLAQIAKELNAHEDKVDRFIAVNHVGRGTEDHALLMRLLDALIAYADSGQAWQTKHGRFTKADLIEHGGIFVRGAIVWPECGSEQRGWHYREPPERR